MTNIHLWSHLAQFFLECGMCQTKVVEKIKTHILCSVNFSRQSCRLRHIYLLLTYSMEQSPSWEANWFAASQEIPHVLWNPKVPQNPKVPHRTHKRPPPVPILSQPNPVLTPISHFLNIHPNITLPSTPGSPQRSLSLRFPHQNPVHTV
jgi:hypothetical protein